MYYPETSNVLGFIEEGVKTELFEPDPLCVERIKERFGTYGNVVVHPVAIVDNPGPVELYRVRASTFLKGLSASPALVNDKYVPDDNDKFAAEGRVFREFDDGTIDVLSIDTEGCEWFVLKHLISRPAAISVETSGKRYRNPYMSEIREWMNSNGYRKWYREGSDTVYVRSDVKVPFLSRWL